MQSHSRKLKIYQTSDGKAPFEKWFNSIKDQKTRAKIKTRLDRAEEGNLGEYRSVGQGVFELKINFGPGYRIYYGLEGDEIVIILCGGDKSTQQNDVLKAQQYWADYKGRQK